MQTDTAPRHADDGAVARRPGPARVIAPEGALTRSSRPDAAAQPVRARRAFPSSFRPRSTSHRKTSRRSQLGCGSQGARSWPTSPIWKKEVSFEGKQEDEQTEPTVEATEDSGGRHGRSRCSFGRIALEAGAHVPPQDRRRARLRGRGASSTRRGRARDLGASDRRAVVEAGGLHRARRRGRAGRRGACQRRDARRRARARRARGRESSRQSRSPSSWSRSPSRKRSRLS